MQDQPSGRSAVIYNDDNVQHQEEMPSQGSARISLRLLPGAHGTQLPGPLAEGLRCHVVVDVIFAVAMLVQPGLPSIFWAGSAP